MMRFISFGLSVFLNALFISALVLSSAPLPNGEVSIVELDGASAATIAAIYHTSR